MIDFPKSPIKKNAKEWTILSSGLCPSLIMGQEGTNEKPLLDKEIAWQYVIYLVPLLPCCLACKQLQTQADQQSSHWMSTLLPRGRV